MTDIVPTLWFDGQAEEAARFYIALIPNSRIGDISWHGEDSAKASGQRPGEPSAPLSVRSLTTT